MAFGVRMHKKMSPTLRICCVGPRQGRGQDPGRQLGTLGKEVLWVGRAGVTVLLVSSPPLLPHPGFEWVELV